MSLPNHPPDHPDRTLKVLSFNVWGLAIVSKDRQVRIKAIAEYLSSSNYDIVCLQELWVYKDFEIVREKVRRNLPFSRFFHTGALGSGLAIFTRFPLISAQALPYSLSGSPAQAFAGDFFVKKAAANIVIIHPILGEVEIWNTHMHAAGEHPPDTRQAHRIAQSWQLANAMKNGAAKGRYILTMGDFNSQPWSIPIAMLRNHGNLTDSFESVTKTANMDLSPQPTPEEALKSYGMTCDSPLNTYSAGKPIPGNVLEKGGKRLDYIFFRQPAIARRRPLVWGYRDEENESESNKGNGAGGADQVDSGDFTGKGHMEVGKPITSSIAKAPKLRCINSEVILTGLVPGQSFSYSDHFALFSTFTIEDPPSQNPQQKQQNQQNQQNQQTTSTTSSDNSFTPLVPLITEPEQINPTTTTFAHPSPESPNINYAPSSPRTSTSSTAAITAKSNTVRSALDVLRLYTRISSRTSNFHLKICLGSLIALIALTIGSAWQPKSWLQPIFTLVGGLLGASTATFLYTGFVWGRWEQGLLVEVTEEMELELRVAEMEERINASA